MDVTLDCIGVSGTIDVPQGVSTCPRDCTDVAQVCIGVPRTASMCTRDCIDVAKDCIDVAQGLLICPRDY